MRSFKTLHDEHLNTIGYIFTLLSCISLPEEAWRKTIHNTELGGFIIVRGIQWRNGKFSRGGTNDARRTEYTRQGP